MSGIDFQIDVIERSRQLPVVVDFWAEWCGPCRVLGPLIEDLAAEDAGRWELVKLDTDRHIEVAQRYGIRNIPSVKMFRHGEIVAEFVGALPRAAIREWLDRHLPDERSDRLAAIVARASTPLDARISGELESFLDAYPAVPPAKLHLARAIVADDPARAGELARAAADSPELAEAAGDVECLAELLTPATDEPQRLAPLFAAARAALARRDLDTALERLVDAASVDRAFADELARRAAVALFRLLGHDHELTRRHQRRLSMILHA